MTSRSVGARLASLLHRNRPKKPDLPDEDDPVFREQIHQAHERLDKVSEEQDMLELRLRVIQRR